MYNLIVALTDFLILYGLYKLISSKLSKKKPKITQYNNRFKSEWTWDEDRQLWVHDSELAKQIKVDHNTPTFEEWKAAKYGQSYHYTSGEVPHKVHISPKTEEAIRAEREIQKNQKQATPAAHSEPKKSKEDQERAEKAVQEYKKAREQALNQPKIIYTYVKAELNEEDKAKAPDITEYIGAYQRCNLFTRNEWRNYQKLKEIADKKGYLIYPKVRLFDLLEPKREYKRQKRFTNKIQSKHVDFVLCDENMKVRAIIELDDWSHYEPDRINRDNFVDMVLLSVGYTVIHTLHIDDEIAYYI